MGSMKHTLIDPTPLDNTGQAGAPDDGLVGISNDPGGAELASVTWPAINTQDALAFCRTILRDEPTEWRLIHPHTGKTRHYWGHPENEEQLGMLAEYNAEGYGVYAVINRLAPTVEQRCKKRQGARDQDVIGIRAFFIDLDDETGPGENARKLAASPLTPTLIVRTSAPHKLQAYWSLRPGEDFPVSDFARVQARLAARFGSDPHVTNPARVMRVPGFWHTKAEPVLSALLSTNGAPHDA